MDPDPQHWLLLLWYSLAELGLEDGAASKAGGTVGGSLGSPILSEVKALRDSPQGPLSPGAAAAV